MNLLHTNYINKTNFLSPTDNTDFLFSLLYDSLSCFARCRSMDLHRFLPDGICFLDMRA